MHPVLKLKDFLTGLASCGKLPLLWGSKNATDRTDMLSKFWRRWRVHDGSHEVFEHHGNHLDLVLPIQLHADEGQTLKKTGVMVLNWQSPIGFGVSTQDDCAAAMSVNFLGSSFATRFLYTTCIKRCYSKKKRYVLDGILENLASELVDLFYNGVSTKIGDQELTLYAALVGLKGDWPIQARIGNLIRHFTRKGVYEVTEKNKGFCHLCCAGQLGYDPNDYGERAAWRSTYLTTRPWKEEGPLCRVVITDYRLAGPGDIPVQLDTVYQMAKEHCQATKTPLHMDGLTRHILKFAADYEYPTGSVDTGIV
eukprot:s7781_g5.t1